MRCPKCTERNSVAARKCEFCGERFKRKPLPVSAKLALGGIAAAITVSVAASYVVPKLVDPEQNLARVGKRLAAGPTSPEDATRIKKEFSDAIKAYLKNVGSSKSADIAAALQKTLDSTAYEVHVTDLPRGLKIVEVDMLLQATDFLVMKTNAGVKVFDLPNFEVCDEARILNDSAGPVLALLGHSGGQPPHKPQLRAYALLPDFVSDESDKLVPPIAGDGTAKFDKDGQHVHLELSLASMAKSDNIDVDGAKGDNIKTDLTWKDAHYVADSDLTQNSAAVAYLVAQAMHHPDGPSPVSGAVIAPAVAKFAKENSQPANQPISVSRLGSGRKGGTNFLVVAAPDKQFVVTLQRTGNAFSASDIRPAAATEVAKAPKPQTAPVAINGTPVTADQTAPAKPAQQPAAAAAPVQPPVNPADKIVVRGSDKLAAAHMPAPAVGGGSNGDALAAAPLVPAVKPAPVAPAVVPKAVAAEDTQKKSKKHRSEHTTTAYINGGSGATLRADATTGAKSLGAISHGEAIQVIGEANGWYHVRHDGQEGYVFGGLVSTTPVASAEPAPPAAAPAKPTREHKKRRSHGGVVVANAPAKHRKSSAVEQPVLVP